MFKWLRAVALASTSAALACGEPTRVSVGELANTIDLTRCTGEGLSCDEEQVWRVPLTLQRSLGMLSECIPDEDPPWHLAWMHPVVGNPCDSITSCRTTRTLVGSDRTLWTAFLELTAAAGAGARRLHLHLGHYAPDGTVLVDSRVDTWDLPPSAEGMEAETLDNVWYELAGNSRGEAVIALSFRPTHGEPIGWMARYGPHGERIGERVDMLGLRGEPVLSVAIEADDSVLVAASNTETAWTGEVSDPVKRNNTALVKLNSSLHVQWLQTATAPGARAVLLGTRGPVVVTDEGDRPSGAQQGITWHDARGTLLGRLILGENEQPIIARIGDAVFVRQIDDQRSVLFREIRSNGDVRWTKRVHSSPMLADRLGRRGSFSVGMGPDGLLFHYFRVDNVNTLIRFDPELNSCGVATFEAGTEMSHRMLAFSEPEHLYFRAAISNEVGSPEMIGAFQR